MRALPIYLGDTLVDPNTHQGQVKIAQWLANAPATFQPAGPNQYKLVAQGKSTFRASTLPLPVALAEWAVGLMPGRGQRAHAQYRGQKVNLADRKALGIRRDLDTGDVYVILCRRRAEVLEPRADPRGDLPGPVLPAPKVLPKWTPEEDKILREHTPHPAQIRELLPRRSVLAIAQRCRALGIQTPRTVADKYKMDPAEVAALWGTRSEAEIAAHFQVSERTIRGILAPMGLKHANRLRVGTVELPIHWTLEDYRAFLDLDPNLSARQAAKALGKPRNSIQLLRKRLKP